MTCSVSVWKTSWKSTARTFNKFQKLSHRFYTDNGRGARCLWFFIHIPTNMIFRFVKIKNRFLISSPYSYTRTHKEAFMNDYILLGDCRENDRQEILIRGTREVVLAKARKYLMHHNKDYFHPKQRLAVKHMTDEQFWDNYCSAWFRSPSLLELPKAKNSI